MALECFRHAFPFGSCCDRQQGMMIDGPPVTVEHIMDQATRGSARCPGCGARRDLREQLRHMPVFGRPEALFGLDSWAGVVTLAARSIASVEIVNLRQLIPYDGEVVYAGITPQASPSEGTGDFFNSTPWVLAPQAAHHPWQMQLPFFVPPGPARRVAINAVVKPAGPIPLARELALQAVGNFHRRQLNIASIMLAASIEASLRPRIEEAYSVRGVKLSRDTGFAKLVEQARMHFLPAFGPQLVGNLSALATTGRNPAAHGNQTSTLSDEEVAMWMVDVAVVYEWSRHATLR